MRCSSLAKRWTWGLIYLVLANAFAVCLWLTFTYMKGSSMIIMAFFGIPLGCVSLVGFFYICCWQDFKEFDDKPEPPNDGPNDLAAAATAWDNVKLYQMV